VPQHFPEFFNQLNAWELTFGHQQDGAECYKSNWALEEPKSWLGDGIIVKELWQPCSPDMTLSLWSAGCLKTSLNC
jgi:hypothetical protein